MAGANFPMPKAIFFVVGGPPDWQLGSTVTGLAGNLFWNFIYNSYSIDDSAAVNFTKLVQNLLDKAVEE